MPEEKSSMKYIHLLSWRDRPPSTFEAIISMILDSLERWSMETRRLVRRRRRCYLFRREPGEVVIGESDQKVYWLRWFVGQSRCIYLNR